MAKTVLGNLQIRLTAITADFTKGINSTFPQLRKFQRVLQTDVTRALQNAAGSLVGGFLKGIASIPSLIGSAITFVLRLAKTIGVTLVGAASAAGVALLYLAKTSAASIDALRKQALSIDSSVESLSILKFAAGEADVELNTLTNAAFKLTRGIAEAARGSGNAKKALDALGLSAIELLQLKPADQFIQVSQALSKVANASERARIGTLLFGKGAKELFPFFAENLAESAKWAGILNAKISDFDAAQIDAAGDSVGRLKAAFTGVGNYLAAGLAPIITGLSNRMLQFIVDSGGVAAIVERVATALTSRAVNLINTVGDGMAKLRQFVGDKGFTAESTPSAAVDSAIGGMAKLLRITSYLEDAFRGAWNTFQYLAGGAIQIALAGIDAIIAGLNKIPGVDIDASLLRGTMEEIVKIGAENATAAQDAWNRLFFLEVQEKYKGVIRFIEQQQAPLTTALTSAVEVAHDGWVRLESAAQNLTADGLQALLDNLKQIAPVTTGAANNLASLGQRASDWFDMIRGEGPSDRINQLTESLKNVKDKSDTFADEMTRIWARTSDSISDSLASAFFDGENALKSLLNVALDVAKQIFSAFLNKSIISPIISAFTSGFGGFGAASTAAMPVAASGFSMPAAGMQTFGAQPAQAGDVINIHFHQPVGSEDAIMEAVDRGLRKGKNQKYIGDVAEVRVSKKNARSPRFAFGS